MSSFFGGGSGSSGGTTTSTSSPDPTQQELNRLYADTVRGVQSATGGLGSFFSGWTPEGRLAPTKGADFSLSPDELKYRDLFLRSAEGAPGLAASYAQLPTLQAIIQAGLEPISTSFGGEGLDVLKGRTDPTALLAAAERYMREIGEPTARATSVAGGMGGVKGGAFQEGLARMSAGLALPIAQMVQGAEGEYGQALMGRDVLREQFGQGRRELAQRGATAFPGIATGLDQTRLGMLRAAQEQAGLPRLAGVQDYLRQQNLAVSALLGIPVMGGQTTTTTQSGRVENDLTLLSLLSVLGPAAGSGIGAYNAPRR